MPDFDHSKCVNPIREFVFLGYFFHVQKATTWWNFTYADGTERISFFNISLMKKGHLIAHQWIIFKYSITFKKK